MGFAEGTPINYTAALVSLEDIDLIDLSNSDFILSDISIVI